MKPIYFFALLTSVIAVGCGGQSPAGAPAQKPVAEQTPGRVPAANAAPRHEVAEGKVYLCHWEAAVTPELAERIRALGTSADDQSRGYDAYVCDGESLVSAIRSGQRGRGLLALGDGLQFPDWAVRDFTQWHGGITHTAASMTVDPAANFVHAQPANCTSTGTVAMDVRDAFTHLKINVTDSAITLGSAKPPILAGELHYKGNIQPGQAVVFLGDFTQGDGKPAVDVLVWQTLRCQYADQLEQTLNVRGGTQSYDALRKWIDNGPEAMLAGFAGDVAWNWQAPSFAEHVDAKWVRTLADGTVIRLVGVSQPYAHPLRWWNAAGKRVAGQEDDLDQTPDFSIPPDQRTIDLLVSAPGDSAITSASGYHDIGVGPTVTMAYGLIQPATQPAATQPANTLVRFAVPAEKGKPIQFNLRFGQGKWADAAAIKTGAAVHLDGCDYVLDDVESVRPRSAGDRGLTSVTARYTDSLDHQTTFAIVWKDGSELLLPPMPRQATDLAAAQIGWVDFYRSAPVDAGDIDHIEVKNRPMAHVTFAGISANPTEPIPSAMPPGRRALVVNPAGHGNDSAAVKAAMTAFQADARTGNAKALAAAFFAPTPADAKRADVQVRLAIAASRLLQAAEAKFGQTEADRTLADDWAINGWAEIGNLDWTVLGLNATPGHFIGGYEDIPLLRNDAGVWKVDCTGAIDPPDRHSRESKIRQLDALSAAVAAGKYTDVFDLRDDLLVPPPAGEADRPEPIVHRW